MSRCPIGIVLWPRWGLGGEGGSAEGARARTPPARNTIISVLLSLVRIKDGCGCLIHISSVREKEWGTDRQPIGISPFLVWSCGCAVQDNTKNQQLQELPKPFHLFSTSAPPIYANNQVSTEEVEMCQLKLRKLPSILLRPLHVKVQNIFDLVWGKWK